MSLPPDAIVVAKGIDGIVLPKLETVDEIRAADWLVASLERLGGERWMAQRASPAVRAEYAAFDARRREFRALTRDIRRQLQQRLLQGARPDLFIGVDAPDFNLDLEAGLKAAGVPTMHFVCPSVWAWRPERIEKIRRSVDHVLCIFPFEPELLQRHGIAATYVGHPLAQVIPMEPDRLAARRQLGLPDQAPVVALLPGSRASEIQYLARRFLEAAALMKRARPGLRFVLPAVPALRERLAALAAVSGLGDALLLLEGLDEVEGSTEPRGHRAIGVVYGDIGTSPLYAFKEAFAGTHGLAVDGVPANIPNVTGARKHVVLGALTPRG